MFWKKKNPVKESTEEATLEKPVDTYNLLDEVAIHTMPTRYKEMHVDGEQAKKTGMLILFGGGLVLVVAIVGVAWILLDSSKDKAKVQVKVEANVSTTSTSEFNQPVIAEPLALMPTVATSSDMTAGSSTVTIEPSVPSIVEQSASSSGPAILAIDTDGDGLFDPEEELLGTNKNDKDSDADTFADLVEVLKGYNPAGTGKLTDNQAIAQYSNNIFSFIYPRNWPFKAQDNGSILFTTPENQMLSISVSDNTANQSLELWYKEQFQVTDIKADQLMIQDNMPGATGWMGVKSNDKLTYYLMDANKKYIVAINYNLGPNNTANFENLVKISVQAFRFK